MKDKFIIFVIGLLLGAVISTGAFYVYTTTNRCNNNKKIQMNGGTPPSMPNGQNNENGTPPEMPNGNTASDSSNNQESNS